MYAPLTRVAVRTPADGDFAAAGWRARPDLSLLRSQHAGFVETLRGLGSTVEVFGATPGKADAAPALATTTRPLVGSVMTATSPVWPRLRVAKAPSPPSSSLTT